MNRLALERLDLRPGERVLEVGFGGGELIEMMLALSPAEVIGADISEAMVRRARRQLRHEVKAGKVRLILAAAEALPLPDAAVDKACSLNSLYFWTDPAAVFAELARVVRPGGKLVIAFEPPEELRKWPGHRFGFRLFRLEEVAALLKAAGFEATEAVWGVGRKPDRFLCLSAVRSGANG